MSNVVRSRMRFSNLNLKLYDITIEYSGKDTAKATFTARLTGTVSNDNKAVDEVREVECELKLSDGKWLFSKFKVVEVLEK